MADEPKEPKLPPLKEPESLVVKTAVKKRLESMNVASDFYEALGTEVNELLEDAAQRAQENDRKTVESRDL